MSSQDDRFPKNSFGSSPEYGARFAEFANAVIPGGRGLVQQLFRAKQEALKGVAHILDAQIHELQHIDAAIEDRAKQPCPPTSAHPPRTGPSLGDVFQKASDLILAKRPKGSAGAEACARPSDRRAPPAGGGATDASSPAASTTSEATASPAPEPVEKISIS
ncbi:hypothetical protein [Corallococcus macrosporus]|uniref:Uncharacterized protein n=1 Tax=Corallococcus macrosporus DSM 14697 TaxID=1189310 RepID=A0A250JXI7_9BACT|nr:hypothetical protein [Corallococcus macrosporus]ATB48584.1 hypothetical protein MYMAC_004211 [Corallococcus macrosporus DSM 14697]